MKIKGEVLILVNIPISYILLRLSQHIILFLFPNVFGLTFSNLPPHLSQDLTNEYLTHINLNPMTTLIINHLFSTFLCNFPFGQTLAIKAFYESHETSNNSNLDRLIWVTKFGMPSFVVTFTICYWVVGVGYTIIG